MDELKNRLKVLSDELNTAMAKLGIDMMIGARNEIREQMKQANFWKSKDAQELAVDESRYTKKTEIWEKIRKEVTDLNELVKLGDSSMLDELVQQVDDFETKFGELKKELRFQGPYDDHDVILNIYAGAGGTDAQDWAQMLERMYLRWAENQKLKAKILDESAGEEAGIKSASIELSGGSYLYGKLAGEHGVHRLVRLSPFNSAASRETSFAKVDVLPVINKPDEVALDEKDLKIDVYRAGGHGGQSVNTTDSAVRITHIPTGVSVAIQNERSQLQNKETALTVLRSRLAQLQLEQHAKTLAEVKGPSQSAEFGNQIRNYVLHPYKQVKDTRTGYESSDVEKILNGNIEPLISAWLENKH